MYKENISYTQKHISKKNGKIRRIYIPNENLKMLLKSLLKHLEIIYINNSIYDCDHAFLKGKNCVTNASMHIHNRYVLSLDIENFFESLPTNDLKKYLSNQILDLILVHGKIIQGFPTSPYLANIAMIEIDNAIIQALNSQEIIYSRYADDLTFSFNNKEIASYIFQKVRSILRIYNLKINAKKTRLQDKKNGRAIITGIGVCMHMVHPTRKTLKKIRAAQHQNNFLSEKGLVSWSLCKIPKQRSLKS